MYSQSNTVTTNIPANNYGQQQFGQQPQPLYGQAAAYPPQNGLNTTANAYFDRPADKRLRPWIILGSVLLAIIGVGMIITPLVHTGHLSIMWAIFISGIALAAASLVGLLAGFTLKPLFAHLFWIVLLAAWVASIVLLIINAIFLNHNMNHHCNNINAGRFSPACDNIRHYNIIVYAIFAPLVACWVPTLLVAALYLARVTTLYRKQERDAYTQQAAPVGSGRF